MAKEVDVEEKVPRVCKRQAHRSNVDSTSPSQFYKRTITIPFLDHLDISFSTRFDSKNMMLFNALNFIPLVLLDSLKEKAVDWKVLVQPFIEFYSDDLPNFGSISAELEVWENFWKNYEGNIPDSVTTTLKSITFPGFENVKICLQILGTVPVTTCSCERSFSGMRFLKNYLRSTMTGERLDGLALLKFHQEIVPDFDDIIDRYDQMSKRRKDLCRGSKTQQ